MTAAILIWRGVCAYLKLVALASLVLAAPGILALVLAGFIALSTRCPAGFDCS